MAKRKRTPKAPDHRPAPLTWPELTAIVEDTDSGKRPRLDGSSAASRTGSRDFAGTDSIAETVEKLRYGWEEGTRAIVDGLGTVEAEADAADAWELDVAGHFPCIPAYVSGQPETMWRLDETGERPRVYLAFDANYACFVPAAGIANYGMALAATVRELEAQGIDVSILAVDRSTGDGNAAYCVGVYVKNQGEPLDLGRIAMSGHPSFLRRALFAYRETTQGVPLTQRVGGYGMPQGATAEDIATMIGDDAAMVVMLPRVQEIVGHNVVPVQTLAAAMAAAIQEKRKG